MEKAGSKRYAADTAWAAQDGYTAMQEMLERALKSNLAQAVTLTCAPCLPTQTFFPTPPPRRRSPRPQTRTRADAVRRAARGLGSFPDQVYRGLVRALQLLVPNRAEHKRLKFPPKAEVLKLFSDCEEFEIMTIGELQKRFANKAITEEMLTAIIEHYDAFQADPDWVHLMEEETNLEAQQRIEVAQQENNDPALLSLICDELDVRLDQVPHLPAPPAPRCSRPPAESHREATPRMRGQASADTRAARPRALG